MTVREAAIRREGHDVTIVGISRMAVTAERAASSSPSSTRSRPRSSTRARCARSTSTRSLACARRIAASSSRRAGRTAASARTSAALIQEQAFDDLDAPIRRVTGADVPMPYAKNLEQIAFPHEPEVVDAVLATFAGTPTMTEIVMPRLSDSMEEGTIIRWLKAGGEEVARRGARRDRDRQGDDDLRVRRRGRAGQIVAQEGDTLAIGGARSRAIGDGAARGLRAPAVEAVVAGRAGGESARPASAPPRQAAGAAGPSRGAKRPAPGGPPTATATGA